MHRVTASLLFLALLFIQTELRQILRMPTLVIHYIEHSGEGESSDLLGFLSAHYGSGQSNHHDEHDDALPFKADQCNTQSVVALEPHACRSIVNQFCPSQHETVSTTSLFLPQSPCADIFQPPRV